MKATMISTDRVVEISDPTGRPALARVWEARTDTGIAFTAYITMVQVATKEDQGPFLRDLKENSKPPSADTRRAIDLRFIL